MRINLLTTLAILSIALFCSLQALDQADWVDPTKLPLSWLAHSFYAGYLNLTADKSFYYVYYPSQSNPSKDPLIAILSPGPGCSSLQSWLYQKGPFIFLTNSTTLRINPFNWNKNANLLFIQGPTGVGFSTSNMNVELNDYQTTQDTYQAILKFYTKFPQLKDQAFYLNGEQYAGVIIPNLALKIVQLNRDRDTPSWQRINLKGILLFNPCTLGDQCDSHFQFSSYTVRYLKNHYFISEQVYNEYEAKCSTTFFQECQDIKQKIQSHFDNTGSDLLNIYQDCLHPAGGKYKCVDYIGIQSFFMDQAVRIDMHTTLNRTWNFCNFTILQKYQRDQKGSYDIYKKLLSEERGLKIWVISGIMNGNVPTIGTKKWFQQLKYDLNLPTLRLWEPWRYNYTINAGDVEQLRGITFATVRSAGFNIFKDQPELGYHVLTQFLSPDGILEW